MKQYEETRPLRLCLFSALRYSAMAINANSEAAETRFRGRQVSGNSTKLRISDEPEMAESSESRWRRLSGCSPIDRLAARQIELQPMKQKPAGADVITCAPTIEQKDVRAGSIVERQHYSWQEKLPVYRYFYRDQAIHQISWRRRLDTSTKSHTAQPGLSVYVGREDDSYEKQARLSDRAAGGEGSNDVLMD